MRLSEDKCNSPVGVTVFSEWTWLRVFCFFLVAHFSNFTGRFSRIKSSLHKWRLLINWVPKTKMEAIVDRLKCINYLLRAYSTEPRLGDKLERCEDTRLAAVMQMKYKLMTPNCILPTVWDRQYPELGFENSMRKTFIWETRRNSRSKRRLTFFLLFLRERPITNENDSRLSKL